MNLPTPQQIAAIYDGIESLGYKTDLQGWNSDLPIFEKLIDQTQAKVAIEIGSWKGRSAVHMTGKMQKWSGDPVLFCVDFWASPCLHTSSEHETPSEHMIPIHWSNTLDPYRLFLHNIKAHGCHQNVVPVRAESSKGAELLASWGVIADLVYVDGGHDMNTCFNDMVRYWPLLREGGIMFGDDYPEQGVGAAVRTFRDLYGIQFTHDDHHWVLEAKK